MVEKIVLTAVKESKTLNEFIKVIQCPPIVHCYSENIDVVLRTGKIVIATPTWNGSMPWELKAFFDSMSQDQLSELKGRVIDIIAWNGTKTYPQDLKISMLMMFESFGAKIGTFVFISHDFEDTMSRITRVLA